MPEKILKTFQVKYVQVMDENGNVDQTMMPKITPDVIKKIYEGMILTKIFDETALSLQREGRMLTFATARGQEAQIIPAFVLRKSDWVVPAFRENGIMIALGYPMEMLYQYWSGDEAGMKVPDGMNCLPAAIPVSTQVAHAMGVAWAEKLKKTDSVVVSYSGDGSTSKSDFHEALNFAGVFKVPLIHIIQNNQWAISVPRSKQTASETLAQKAIAYGFEGVQVDGNDVFAMYKVISEAVEKARKGGGPTLVEMYTYRLGDHTTADDWKKYRDPKEVEEWLKKDPIIRLEKYMMRFALLDENMKKNIWDECKRKVNEAVAKYEAMPLPKPQDMFDYIYEKIPAILQEQRDSVGQ